MSEIFENLSSFNIVHVKVTRVKVIRDPELESAISERSRVLTATSRHHVLLFLFTHHHYAAPLPHSSSIVLQASFRLKSLI